MMDESPAECHQHRNQKKSRSSFFNRLKNSVSVVLLYACHLSMIIDSVFPYRVYRVIVLIQKI